MNKFAGIFELHEKFGKHEVGEVCCCGRIKVIKSYMEEGVIKAIAMAIKEKFGDEDIDELFAFNINKFQGNVYYYAKIFSHFDIKLFSPANIDIILGHGDISTICENSDPKILISLIPKIKKSSIFLEAMQRKLCQSQDISLIKEFISLCPITSFQLLIRIPFNLFPRIKFGGKYIIELIDDISDVEDILNKINYLIANKLIESTSEHKISYKNLKLLIDKGYAKIPFCISPLGCIEYSLDKGAKSLKEIEDKFNIKFAKISQIKTQYDAIYDDYIKGIIYWNGDMYECKIPKNVIIK